MTQQFHDDQSFGKGYRLSHKKIIDQLFKNGNVIKAYPLVLYYLTTELPSFESFQIVVTAPKKMFKRSHDRNRIKRLLREGIRKNKLLLETECRRRQQQVALFLIFTSKELPDFAFIDRKIKHLMNSLNNELQTKHQNQLES
jgi:ribonuclease P protein component